MRSSLFVLGAGVLLFAVGFAVLGSLGRGTAALVPEHAAEAPQFRAAEPTDLLDSTEPSEPAARLPAAAQDEPAGIGSNWAEVRLRAVDALSGIELDRVRVRAASPTRIADRHSEAGSAELLLKLTPGEYTLLLFSRGYEPLELPAVQLAGAARRVFDPLRMQEGSARIAGLATGELQFEPGLHAELFGEGRRPCALCMDVPTSAPSSLADRDEAWQRAEPCPACGFAAKFSRRPLAQDGRFTFERLVSGSYALRLLDAQERPVGLPKNFELRAGQVLGLECEVPALRMVELELFDVDGTSLASEWAARIHATAVEDESIESVVESSNITRIEFACTFQAGQRCVGRAELVPPLPPGSAGTAIGVGRSGAFSGRRLGGASRGGPDDRPRASTDALRPVQPAPEIPPAAIAAGIDAHGRARFAWLPSIPLTLELACGPFHASVAIPAGRETSQLRAQLTREGSGTLREYEAGPQR